MVEDMTMTVERVEPGEFAKAFPKGSSHVFNTAEFAELNRGKCAQVHYLLFSDSKVRMGIVLGERDDALLSPFSAPFGGFCYTKDQLIEVVDGAVSALREYGRRMALPVEIFLPPEFYAPSMQPKVASSLLRHGTLMYAEYNHYRPLDGYASEQWREVAEGNMNMKARKKFRQSFDRGFEVALLDAGVPSDITRVYDVIAANRASKGYPLRMSREDVARTVPLVGATLMVMSYEGADVAAALVYPVSDGIMQVVYWGDAPGFEELHPMYRFAPEVMHACASMDASVLDIGPSSERGVPSPGLCFFKESIGCLATLKPRFRLE